MPYMKILSINILYDLSRWRLRRDLLAQGILDLDPDVVAVQEANLPGRSAEWLSEHTKLPHRFISPKVGFEKSKEGLAILSKLPLEENETLDLIGQNRIAQRSKLTFGRTSVLIVNGHFFWQPGESKSRLHQVNRLIRWLEDYSQRMPVVVCGDFNSTPETTAIQRMYQSFSSAHRQVNGAEPEFTCPTPLPRSFKSQLRTFLGFFLLIRPKHYNPIWRGTLDYIFTNHRIKPVECRVVLDKSAAGSSNIYPSDHLGIFARLTIGGD